MSGPSGVVVQALIKPGFDAILTPAALQFLARLHREFEPRIGLDESSKSIRRRSRIGVAGEIGIHDHLQPEYYQEEGLQHR